MSGKFLLDTNIVIAFFAEDEDVLENMQEADEFSIPSVVLGELYFGARKSSNSEQNIQRIDELASNTNILACDIETARHYGRIKLELRQKGKPVPENDIWIAAIAQQHELNVVSRDKHFEYVKEYVTDVNVSKW